MLQATRQGATWRGWKQEQLKHNPPLRCAKQAHISNWACFHFQRCRSLYEDIKEPYYLWLNVTMTVYEEPSQIPFKYALICLPAKCCHDRNGTTDWSLGQLVLTICRVPMCSWTFHGRPQFQISFPLSDHMFQSLVMWIHPWKPHMWARTRACVHTHTHQKIALKLYFLLRNLYLG